MKERKKPIDPFDDPPEEKLLQDMLGAEKAGAVAYPGTDESPRTSKVESICRKHESQILAIKGVTGTGIGSDEIGNDIIVVYVRDASVRKLIPTELEGIPVKTEITGEIDAY